MRRAGAVLLLLLGVLAPGAACGSARRGEPLAGEFEPADRSVRKGRHAFMLHCQKCHPGGEAGLGPALNDKPLPVFLMRLQVRKGLGAMPAFPESRISSAELDDLLEFLVAYRRHGAS